MSDLELREKVARLMGWRQAHDGAWIMPPKITDDATTAGALWELPAYETDVAAAWEVVEFMRERHPGDTAPPAWMNFWEAGFFEDDARTLWRLSAENAATAICKAFVAVMEARDAE